MYFEDFIYLSSKSDKGGRADQWTAVVVNPVHSQLRVKIRTLDGEKAIALSVV